MTSILTPKPADDVAGLPDVTELMWSLDEAIDVFGKAAEHWGWESDQGSDADAEASEAEAKRTRSIVYDKADLVAAALRFAHATIATLRRQIDERDAEVTQARAEAFKEAALIADGAFHEITKQTPWDEGMRDMAVRISSRLRALIPTKAHPHAR